MPGMNPWKLASRRSRGRRWPVVDGTVIDKRHLQTRDFRGESMRATISYDEYLVEVVGADGEPLRVRIEEDHGNLPKKMTLGTNYRNVKVKVHLHPDGERAVFAKDPSESRKDRKRREKERLARDEERFRRQGG